METWNIVHKKAYFGFLTKEGAVLIQLLERTNQVGWESKGGSSTGRRKKWLRGEGPACRLIAKHIHTHKHRQRSHSLTRHPILSQTGGKMLYFPSKLKCQLILMWKRRGPNTQCMSTQAAFTLTDTSFGISNVALPSRYRLMESCTRVTEGCASPIRPTVASHPICLMKAISKLRCSCGWQKSGLAEMDVNMFVRTRKAVT